MKMTRRTKAVWVTILAFCVAAFIALQTGVPGWVRTAGLDFWTLAEEHALEKCENERRVQLDADADELAQLVAAIDSIAHSVIENQLDFQVAVERCIEIHSSRSGFLISLRSEFPSVTDSRELQVCYLRMKIEDKLSDNPTKLATVLARIPLGTQAE